jgi:hypothetical protein
VKITGQARRKISGRLRLDCPAAPLFLIKTAIRNHQNHEIAKP